MSQYVLSFQEIDQTCLKDVGGKGANLGEMTQAGFPVPKGFCVTTAAYRAFIETSRELDGLLEPLNRLEPDQLDRISHLGKQIREHLKSLSMPEEIRSAILQAWKQTGTHAAYAVRSSATAEDLPTASFAGQQETFLNVIGENQLLQSVQNCWASLFTDRAIAYRIKNGFDHRSVFLSVVIQQMVFPEVSGILFTADPVTGHRKTSSMDASFGLGEALVSGIVSADLYQVRSGQIIKKQVSEKKTAIYALPEGGTVTREIPLGQQKSQALSDQQIVELTQLGQQIEKHYGIAQDIEWALADGEWLVLQGRPITSLYPLPGPVKDQKFRVYFSFGHQQMMTEAMKPLAISLLRTLFPFGKENPTLESRVMLEAGGRLFIDPTDLLYWKPGQKIFPRMLSNVDERISHAISEIIQREAFQKQAVPDKQVVKKARRIMGPVAVDVAKNLIFRDSSQALRSCNEWMERFVENSQRGLAGRSGVDRIQRIQKNVGSLMFSLFQHFLPYLLSGLITLKMIRHFSIRWLGHDRDVHRLNQSLTGNVTSEMGLALGDLADEARPYPEVIAALRNGKDPLDPGWDQIPGGDVFQKPFDRFIDRYGMRCPGEIDITNPRWREAPAQLVPSILNHIQNVKPGEHRENFREGKKDAEQAAQSILSQVRQTRGGVIKEKWMKRLITVYRNVMGLREHPKYMMVRHFDLYKRAILDEADGLVKRGVLQHRTDVFYLTLNEILALLKSHSTESVQERIDQRKKEYEQHQKRTPPRVITSEGEVVTGLRQDPNIPEGSLPGTAVSPGVAEGYARVVLNPGKAELKPGEILIAPFTDPGWTPLFHSAKALVMEVGGMMTHGAVVAREYGIPAVVGVDEAIKTIRDGQYIRVDGSRGYVQIMDEQGTGRLQEM
ncbi:phosphoenolpyruvate synthase [Paludifilum halophilum]|uniref:Phosphoenolpyruvate synthase n=1 Tax=Paludifilum halophilum TaxID=1642702 RepID=A0A235B8A4_9BACL|nr:phosphoenolpyruvate synthase [Paludifilum halophilum]OYD08516.1 phosphoenolpyruvate synthase [Paludifilum halophilum]